MPAFPLVEADPRVLLPCPDAENIRRDAARWSDAVHAAARLVCPDTGAIPAVRPDRMVLGVEKSAVREPLLADADLDRLAWVLSQARHASADVLAEHWRPAVSVAVGPCRQAVGRFAA